VAFGALLAVLGPASAASGAPAKTYYVSPTGNDGGQGTLSSPWQTLARVSAANLGPGDHVYLQGGATFTGNLQLTNEDSGTPTKPVIIDSYGTGRATISSGAARGVSVYNASGVALRNLRVVGSGRDNGGDIGVLFYADLPNNVLLPYVRVTDVEVSGYSETGITIGSFNGRTGFSDVRIERVASHDNADSGLITYAAVPYVHKNVYVGASRFYMNQGQPNSTTNSGSGLVLGGVDGGTVENNLAYLNGGLNTAINGGVGIWAYDSTRILIQRNESYNNKTGSAADGGGFNFDHGTSQSTMQFNYSHGNAGSGFMLAHNFDTATHTGNVIRYNVSQNDGRKNGTSAIRVWGHITDAEIYQNTISLAANSSSPKAVRIDGRQPTGHVHLRNNIFRTTGGAPLLQVSAAVVTNNIDLLFQGNDWYTSGGTFKFLWGTKTYGSLAAWRTATGSEKVGTQAVGTSADPLFVGGNAPTIGDPSHLGNLRNYYNLSAGSTIVDKGLNLASFGITPSPVDFSGSPSPHGAAVDPGAFER
jgi:hypothetical protein